MEKDYVIRTLEYEDLLICYDLLKKIVKRHYPNSIACFMEEMENPWGWSALAKISIVCRKTTERPEGIKTGHLHLCDNPDKLSYYVDSIANNNFVITNKCPYGDGKSSEKIIKILRDGNSNS